MSDSLLFKPPVAEVSGIPGTWDDNNASRNGGEVAMKSLIYEQPPMKVRSK